MKEFSFLGELTIYEHSIIDIIIGPPLHNIAVHPSNYFYIPLFNLYILSIFYKNVKLGKKVCWLNLNHEMYFYPS